MASNITNKTKTEDSPLKKEPANPKFVGTKKYGASQKSPGQLELGQQKADSQSNPQRGARQQGVTTRTSTQFDSTKNSVISDANDDKKDGVAAGKEKSGARLRRATQHPSIVAPDE